MGRLLSIALLIGAIVLMVSPAAREALRRSLPRVLLFAGVGGLVLLAVTGRLHWLFAVLGALVPVVRRLLPLLRFLPLVGHLYQRARAAPSGGTDGASAGGASTVETGYLRMMLEPETGAMDGVVLQGAYRGRRLSGMDLDELRRLLAECRSADADAAALLQAYLDRVHGERDRGGEKDGGAGRRASPAREMDRAEALAVLGLGSEATADEIVAAHRRLMQRLHPDRGGSDYLAARINEAKTVLLGDTRRRAVG